MFHLTAMLIRKLDLVNIKTRDVDGYAMRNPLMNAHLCRANNVEKDPGDDTLMDNFYLWKNHWNGGVYVNKCGICTRLGFVGDKFDGFFENNIIKDVFVKIQKLAGHDDSRLFTTLTEYSTWSDLASFAVVKDLIKIIRWSKI